MVIRFQLKLRILEVPRDSKGKVEVPRSVGRENLNGRFQKVLENGTKPQRHSWRVA